MGNDSSKDYQWVDPWLGYEEQNEEIKSKIEPNSFEDRAFGCLFGAFIGDSCGSVNEFASAVLEDEEALDKMMTMPGQGPWMVAPGQVTDDSELILCMLQGIVKGNEKKPEV